MGHTTAWEICGHYCSVMFNIERGNPTDHEYKTHTLYSLVCSCAQGYTTHMRTMTYSNNQLLLFHEMLIHHM